MEEYVAKSVLKKELNIANLHSGIISALQNIVDKIPAADVRKAKHGKWVFNKDDACFADGGLYCSLCERYGVRDSTGRWNKTNYCPYCGAIMDGKDGQ